jgi:hypothetical protein
MTESSWPWNGTTVGHAATGAYTAPYSAEEYTLVYARNGCFVFSGSRGGGVILGHGGGLLATQTAPASANVIVPSGVAIVGGLHYYNDTNITIPIAPNTSGYPRLDRIVLRADWSAQTVTVDIIQGTPSASPVLPSLTQTWGTIWEVPLVWIYVANGFSTIETTDIHDDRRVLDSHFAPMGERVTNLITNSEFLAFSGLSLGTGLVPPDRWALVGTPTSITSTTRPSAMERGRAVRIVTDAVGEGISQTFPVLPNQGYVVSGLINNTSGGCIFRVTTNSTDPLKEANRYIRVSGQWIDEIIAYATQSDATTMTVSVLSLSASSTFSVGQITARRNYRLAYSPFHEIIPFDYRVSDASWSGAAKSTGVTTINLNTNFGGIILPGTSGVFVNVGGSDSASAGSTTARIAVRPTAGGLESVTAYPAGKANNAPEYSSGLVSLDGSLQFQIAVTATGTNTFSAHCYLAGIVT